MRHIVCGNMYMPRVLISLFLILVSSHLYGQILKFDEVVMLPTTINSDTEESMPVLSNDGNTMYFVRSFYKENKGGKFAGQDIWVSTKEDSIWNTATNQLKYINNKKNNAVIGVKEDGKTLYLLDSYGGTVHGIAFTKYINGKWTKPENIPIKGINRDGYIGYYMNPTYDVLLISMSRPDSYGKEDLYVSLKDSSNRWSQPHNLGTTINSSGFEISPFLTPDKKYLFFASDGHPGFGNADIFVSERLYDSWDIWSVPKNLGPEINSKNFDAFFTLTSDSTVYLASNRNGKNADIYESYVVVDKTNIYKARMDSLIKEANAILAELRTIKERNSEELLFLYDYNKFEVTNNNLSKLDSILLKIEDKSQIMVQLISFSFEDYSEQSKKLISSKREQSLREALVDKGISSINIFSESISDEMEKQFKNEEIGGVKIKISY